MIDNIFKDKKTLWKSKWESLASELGEVRAKQRHLLKGVIMV